MVILNLKVTFAADGPLEADIKPVKTILKVLFNASKADCTVCVQPVHYAQAAEGIFQILFHSFICFYVIFVLSSHGPAVIICRPNNTVFYLLAWKPANRAQAEDNLAEIDITWDNTLVF